MYMLFEGREGGTGGWTGYDLGGVIPCVCVCKLIWGGGGEIQSFIKNK